MATTIINEKINRYCHGWEPTIRIHPLAAKVLAAATTRIEGTWKAYINSVPGKRHDLEYNEVLRHGDEIPEHIAKVMFPDFADLPYAR